MSIYNVACHHGALNLEIVKDAWIGFPIAYCFAMCCDWFWYPVWQKALPSVFS